MIIKNLLWGLQIDSDYKMADIDTQIQELEAKNTLLEKQIEALQKTFQAAKLKTIQEFDAQVDKLLKEQQQAYEKEISVLTQNLQADDNNIDEIQKQVEGYKPRIDKISSKNFIKTLSKLFLFRARRRRKTWRFC